MIRASQVPTKRWTRTQYEKAIECGIFRDDERLELLDGVLVVKEPQGEPHAAAVDLVALALRRAFGDGWLVRQQLHFAASRVSRPEPDVYVVPGSPRDYAVVAPRRPVLIVEVSQSRLGFDRNRKSAIYARGRGAARAHRRRRPAAVERRARGVSCGAPRPRPILARPGGPRCPRS